MNLLTPLPQHIEVKGKQLKINTGFKAWFGFAKAIKRAKTDADIINALEPVFLDKFDLSEIDDIIKACFDFFVNAKSFINPDTDGEASKEIAYDLELDSNYIFSAFMEQYGIDLTENDIHYYKFVALFDSLSDDTLFKRIVSIRTKDISKEDSKLQASYRKLKQLFEINENAYMTQEEIAELRRAEQIEKEKFIAEWGL